MAQITVTLNGSPVTGTATNGVSLIPPPALSAMNYDALADLIVTPSNVPSWMMSQQSSSYYGDDLTGSTDALEARLGALADWQSFKLAF